MKTQLLALTLLLASNFGFASNVDDLNAIPPVECELASAIPQNQLPFLSAEAYFSVQSCDPQEKGDPCGGTYCECNPEAKECKE